LFIRDCFGSSENTHSSLHRHLRSAAFQKTNFQKLTSTEVCWPMFPHLFCCRCLHPDEAEIFCSVFPLYTNSVPFLLSFFFCDKKSFAWCFQNTWY